jgi:chromate reductase, NAD(P)H dehydrogenase (quinone)
VTAKGRRLRFLALSGSLRSASTNTALLEATRLLAPPHIDVTLFRGLAALPLFNPDHDHGERPLPPAAAGLRAEVGASDALLIACPEYAHGVPGSFKNALDWLVGGPEFPGKPVALFQGTTRGSHVRASLEDILATMSGRIVSDACLAIHLVGQVTTAEDLAADGALAPMIRKALLSLGQAVGSGPVPKPTEAAD